MKTDTIIIGGGQAGLSISYYLKSRGVDHIILEKASEPASTWKNGRWDSFTLVSPNFSFRMPGAVYAGDNPDGFLTRNELVEILSGYIKNFQLPVMYDQNVNSVKPTGDNTYLVTTSDMVFESNNVVVAAGLFQYPKIPPVSKRLPQSVTQLHSGEYRNPHLLPEGDVLVAGSGQSGCQIADELNKSGRKVYLSTGGAGRAPRRYRGKDVFEWLDLLGFFDRSVEMLPDPSFRFLPNPHLSGSNGGQTLNLHRFAAEGITLLGRILDADTNTIKFKTDLKENLTKADSFEKDITGMIDDYIDRMKIEVPEEVLPVYTQGFNIPDITELEIKSGITVIIWACGYSFNFDFVKLPVFDNYGYPVQKRGETKFPGLYFLGLPWLHKVKSGLFMGIGDDAEYIADKITANKKTENISS